jgi:hypothetical protein
MSCIQIVHALYRHVIFVKCRDLMITVGNLPPVASEANFPSRKNFWFSGYYSLPLRHVVDISVVCSKPVWNASAFYY